MARRIPMTAREQLVRARDLGHEVAVETRTFPEYPDVPPKFTVTCTCGYRSTARRSKSAVGGTIVWHLSKVIGYDEPHVNGT